jgi:plasmid stabilization system protein ParE
MGRSRTYHPAVADDLKSATRYYDAISTDLGNRFRDVIRSRLQDVRNRPESFGVVRDEFRAAGVRRFPYVILFTVDDERVLVVGIFHAHSDQQGWFARLGRKV